MSEEEKKAVANLIDSCNLSLIGDGTVITSNITISVILNLIEKQQQELQLKDKVIKEAIEKCKTEIKILEELADEEYQTYGRSSEYELYSEQLDTLIDIKEKLENK